MGGIAMGGMKCAICATAISMLLGLTACGSPPVTTLTPVTPVTSADRYADSLVDFFKQELALPNLSEFEQAVFTRAVQTGKISQANYEEAQRQFNQCLEDVGWNVTWMKGADGVYVFADSTPEIDSQAAVDQWIADSDRCGTGSLNEIGASYCIQQDNPWLYKDEYLAVIACWDRAGKTIPGYGPADLKREMDATLAQGYYVPSDYSFDTSDQVVMACLRGNGFGFSVD